MLTSWAYYLYLSLIFKNFTAGIFKPLIKKINMEVNTTENKTLEQDYRDLAGLLSNIVDSLPIYFFVKDTGDNFRYVYSSPLMNQLYGRYHNDVVGKTDFDLFLDPVVAQSFRDMDEEVGCYLTSDLSFISYSHHNENGTN